MEIDYLCSEEQQFLVAKGDISKSEIIAEAKNQNAIEQDDNSFNEGEYFQSWYKVVPAPRNWGYRTWHYPVKTQCRGAYFASVIVIG